MRINNSSFDYFGLFLSVAMERLGHLGALYTNLPASRLGELPSGRRRSMPAFAAPAALRKLGYVGLAEWIEPAAVRLFARWVGAELADCDIFHSFSSFGLEAFAAARRRWGAMTIVERGSSHIRFQNELLVEEYARWGVPFAGIPTHRIEREEQEYAVVDRITVQSTFAEKTFVARGIPPEKIIKLPLGVDLNEFHPAPRTSGTFRVLYGGQGTIRKGLVYLFEAVAPLKLPNFELAMTGSIAKEMEPIAQRYAGLFRHLGFFPRSKLREAYSSASVFVLPTIEDGFAKVVSEAMACGVPVIATHNCGAPDIIEDGVDGFLVPIRSPEAIRDKILFLYENPEVREAMGRAALQKARTAINWNAYGERAAHAYARALQAHRASPPKARG